MRLWLVVVGTRQPSWVNEAVDTYLARLPRHLHFELKEVAAAHRRRQSAERSMDEEADRVRAAVPAGTRLVAFERTGRPLGTATLAERLRRWMEDGRDVALVIGGPDGLSAALLAEAAEVWSLTNLVLPHGLARVVVAEQIYRAWSVVEGMPYHRESP